MTPALAWRIFSAKTSSMPTHSRHTQFMSSRPRIACRGIQAPLHLGARPRPPAHPRLDIGRRCRTRGVPAALAKPGRYDPFRGTLRSYLLSHAHGRSVDLIRSEAARRSRQERTRRRINVSAPRTTRCGRLWRPSDCAALLRLEDRTAPSNWPTSTGSPTGRWQSSSVSQKGPWQDPIGHEASQDRSRARGHRFTVTAQTDGARAAINSVDVTGIAKSDSDEHKARESHAG